MSGFWVVWFSNGRGQKLDELKADLQKVWISNFHCNLNFSKNQNSQDLNTDHLKTGNIWVNFMKFGFLMVQYSIGRSMGYVLCTRLTIGIPDQNIRKQDGTHLSGIQMLGCLAFKWHSKTRPFGIQPLYYHLNTRLVQYLDLHCIPLFEL